MDDALKWDENFYHPRVGGEAMVDELQQRGTLTNGDSIGYGRGLFLGHNRGLRRVEHGGDWIGYHAAYARYPEQHTSVIVLCNSDGISPEGLDDRAADVWRAPGDWLAATSRRPPARCYGHRAPAMCFIT